MSALLESKASAWLYLQAAQMLDHKPCVKVLAVEPDERHISTAKSAVKQARSISSKVPYSA